MFTKWSLADWYFAIAISMLFAFNQHKYNKTN